MTDQSLQDQFWIFSCAFYDKDGIKEVCLELQDTYNADVNIILFCLWLAKQNIILSPEDFQQIDQKTSHWRTQIIHPLRQARRQIQDHHQNEQTAEIRKGILENELAAEKFMQSLLIGTQDIKNLSKNMEAPEREIARKNLESYGGYIEEFFPSDAIRSLLEKF